MDIIGVKQLRGNINRYIAQIKKGQSFIVVRRSKPVFKLVPPEQQTEIWEPVIDFTQIKRGGIQIKELLSRL